MNPLNWLAELWHHLRNWCGEVGEPFDYAFPDSAPAVPADMDCPDTQPTAPGALDSDLARLE